MDMNTLIPTNTFANATFDVLKMDGFEDPLINVDKLSAMDLEESYFLKTVDFLKENMSDYTKAKITLYKTISEATSDTVVLEGFSDFFTSVKEIIDKFLKWIKQLFQRFINTLNSLIASDKYLQKHKKDIDKFRSEDEFEIKGYNFTFQDNIPATEIAQDWSASLFAEINSGGDVINTEIVRSANSILNDYNDSYYDSFRGKVLGKEENISSTDFSEEMFKIFRDGELDTDSITVDTGYIRLAKERYFNYKKTISDVKRQQKRIEDAYHAVEKQLKDIVSNNGKASPSQFISMLPDGSVTSTDKKALDSEGKLSGEFMAQIDIFVKNKVQQIQEISNIHALAFSAKLDAEKDCFKQDKATLYTALSKIYKNGAKRESVENIDEEDK